MTRTAYGFELQINFLIWRQRQMRARLPGVIRFAQYGRKKSEAVHDSAASGPFQPGPAPPFSFLSCSASGRPT